MKLKHLLPFVILAMTAACSKDDHPNEPTVNEDPATFTEIGTLDIGIAGAAEISAYDPSTKRLFVVNNGGRNKIDVIDMSDPAKMKLVDSILTNSGAVNSVSVSDGKLAAAIEALDKQQPGKVTVYNTSNYQEIKTIATGSLPDMVTFSPDGNYILTANEGEPDATYTNDPIGSVSVISVKDNYSVVTIDFSSFASQQAALQQRGLRVFGPNASFAQDMEPEYITVSPDSKTAWVTLQENNAIGKIDLTTKTATDIFPLGFKDYNNDTNTIDPSDKDNSVGFGKWSVKGMYQPDAIAVLQTGGIPYLFTVNEGDVREYTAFKEADRIKNIALDPTAFPNAAELQADAKLGRLNITKTLGDANGDGLYETLFSFGARSFSVWNGVNGSLIYDSKNELEVKTNAAGYYDDARSDDKGVEPEGITLGQVGNKNIAFIGMERADAIAIYDVSIPNAPSFLQILKSGDAPEGVLFVPAKNSPTGKSLLIISNEDDGVLKVYTPKTL
ncbi:choice-of-anchor I family protein [Chitinophaga filiformis]|uniref:choice-of-anchor I family protein n=1 Tax=Chitinophaga filiformis TaxID=104663 RepID=UPI001F46531A|nr:choice-of-anchor I family protein [Chitinophaga filiformis]MCF6402538.1 choice-of-anchor I family protein [Chitinophaga filiformis]MCF6403544.1 choice-of-anchor I family protein [Chitinophaga filiformis]